MHVESTSAVVTGGSSGLGLATVRALAAAGAHVVIADLNPPTDEVLAELGDAVTHVTADVTDTEQVTAALNAALDRGPLRTTVNCAGRGALMRIVNRDGTPGDLDTFAAVTHTNLVGTFNVTRLAAAAMATQDPVDGERGVIVLTSSVAAFEGQVGQAPYAASKAGVAGFTICAARDLATRNIRVMTIAPGLFDTPMLGRLPQSARDALATTVPNPARLGAAEEFADLALAIVRNPMLNGETIRLDGALRMAPR